MKGSFEVLGDSVVKWWVLVCEGFYVQMRVSSCCGQTGLKGLLRKGRSNAANAANAHNC